MFLDGGCVLCDAVRGPVCGECESGFAEPDAVSARGLDACRARYRLDDDVRHAIASLKYRGERRMASWFAARAVSLLPMAADAVTWVPTTAERQRSRGYDQSGELARAIGVRTGMPVIRLLQRERGDERQTGRSRAARTAGPTLAALGSVPEFVVLVDDVMTTGASLNAAADRLRGAGARRVVGLVLASTPMTGEPISSTVPTWK